MRLISDEHRDQYRQHYATKPIGERPTVWLPRIEQMALHLDADDILDYGCGNARGLSRFSLLNVRDYDPGVPGVDAPPTPADLVVCIHTLEHVEPETYGAVIEDLHALARKAVLLVISCEPSTKVLPNGRAWHSLVRPPEWWRQTLVRFTEVPTIKDPSKEFAAVWRRT